METTDHTSAEPRCASRQHPPHGGYACSLPQGHGGQHEVLMSGGRLIAQWPDETKTLRCTFHVAEQQCIREDQHEGLHHTDQVRSTGAIVTDEQRLQAIRRLAASMETPPHILTQREVVEAQTLSDSNRYTLALPQIDEPKPYARAVFTLTTESGEIINLAFEAHPAPDDQEEWAYVASPVESVIRALRGIGYHG